MALRGCERAPIEIIEDIPRRSLHIVDHGLADRLAQLSELDDDRRRRIVSLTARPPLETLSKVVKA
jgi:hypothetical protein